MRRKIIYTGLLALIILYGSSTVFAQRGIPGKPEPPRLVNDLAGLLNSSEISSLENKLVAFSDSTSTQMVIVIVNDLGGYEPEEFAERIGDSWGVGQKGKNNGLVLLVKTRTAESRGEVIIKPGYGLEGAIPDITCGRIIDYEILPEFRNGNYYEGLDKATNTLMSLARGEFTADQYNKKGSSDLKKFSPIIGFLIIFIIIVALISSGKSNQNNIGGKRRGSSDLPLWLLLAMMNSGKGSHRGSWGGFSGRGGFGGGGGDFGGFGGGSFGGGGAGGSW